METPGIETDTLEARLIQQFYEWEIIGRGVYVFPEPVQLEPVFRPFFGHYDPLPLSPISDDARKPTFLSSLIEGIKTWALGKRKSEEPLEEAETNDHDIAYRFDNIDPLVEIQLALPSEAKVSQGSCEQFVLSLGHVRRPVSFEVVGTEQAVIIQVTAGVSDSSHVREQLRAFFPDAQVVERAGYLSGRWHPERDRETAVVEFALAREFMRPIRCYDRFEPDPLAGIIGAMASLRQEDCVVLQVLFNPVLNPWPDSLMRAVTDGNGKPFFVDDPELVRLTGQKVSAPLYAVSVRIGVQTPNVDRTWSLAQSVANTLRQFSDPNGNELTPILNEDAPVAIPPSDIVNRRSHRTGMILNSEELLSLVHLPSPSVRSERLKREDRRTKAAPSIAVGRKLVLGVNEHDSKHVEVTLGPEQRSRHLYLIGASGTGKSTLLLNMIVQDIENGDGIGVLDPHGDLIDQILERVPEERIDDVVVFDPSDEQYPVGFNMLSAHSELERNLLASDLISVFRRLSTSWGDQMNTVFGNAILAFLESNAGGTLLDLRRFLVEAEFRNRFLQTVQDPDVVYYWQKEFPLLSGKPQGPILTRLDTFLRPKLIRQMVAQHENRLDFGAIMNLRGIFLAKLSQGLIGEENSYLLGTLLVSKINQMAMSRQELQSSERKPFYLYVDEFHNFVTPSMAAILSGARKYNLGLVLAHQDLQQLASRNTDVASSVIANPYTRVCFRLGDYDAKKLEDGFSFFKAKDLQNLSVGEAICRMERADYDFNLKTLPLPKVERIEADLRREQILASSREKYAVRSEDAVSSAVSPQQTKLPPPARVPEPRQTPLPNVEQIATTTRRPEFSTAGPKPPSTPGRGGPQHKYLQQLIKRWAESKGYRVTIEKQILDGLGSVDVALEKEGQSIACEISMTTSPEHELGNIQKCLAAGFSQVVMLSTDKKVLLKIQALAQSLPPSELERVRFCLPEELFAFLEAKDSAPPAPQTVRGYTVKVKLNPVQAAEQKTKQEAIAKTVLQAMRRLKEK